MFFREGQTSDLSRGQTIQSGMGTDEVKEKDEHGDEVVGCGEGRKALLCFVPRLELLIEALNEVVGDVVLKALNANMFAVSEDGLDRHFVSAVTVRNDSSGLAVGLGLP